MSEPPLPREAEHIGGEDLRGPWRWDVVIPSSTHSFAHLLIHSLNAFWVSTLYTEALFQESRGGGGKPHVLVERTVWKGIDGSQRNESTRLGERNRERGCGCARVRECARVCVIA